MPEENEKLVIEDPDGDTSIELDIDRLREAGVSIAALYYYTTGEEDGPPKK